MRTKLALAALSVLFSQALACQAVDLSSTEILNIQGRVEVKKGTAAAFKKLNRNLKLSGSLKRLDSGDKVRTYLKSAAEMALKETCILAVKEQSLFEVPKSLGKDAVTQLKAQQGSLLFKVISGNNFEVRTADVIAGVKGTLFEMDIVDSFNTLLETPGLELGTIAPGGTMVNVFKGEVELTHANTGKTRRLAAGEGITVFNDSLTKLSNSLRDGFGVIRKFDPANLLRKNFGGDAVGLLSAAPNLSGLTNFKGLGAINSALETPGKRINNLFSGLEKNVAKDLRIGNLDLGTCIDILNDLKDEKFKADFSKYSAPKSTFSINDNKFREVFIGCNTFAACKASMGSKMAKMEPTPEGLILLEGNGAFRFVKYTGSNSNLEFVSSFYKNQGQNVTSVQVLKGELFGRITGEIEYFKIPAGKVAFVVDSATGRGSWVQANSHSFEPSLNNYKFKVAEKMSKERKKINKKNTKKKINAVKKLIKFKRFGF